MSSLGTPLLLLVFAAAAAAIWIAGIQLSDQTDVLSTRLHVGSALGGLILLAVATNLPETAIVASAALSGSVGVAVGNILGGIAIQTVVLVVLVLVVLDAFGVGPGPPLTYRAASLVLVLEGLAVVAILATVVAGTQLPGDVIVWRLTPESLLIAVLGTATSRGPGACVTTDPCLPPASPGLCAGRRSRRRRPSSRGPDGERQLQRHATGG